MYLQLPFVFFPPLSMKSTVSAALLTVTLAVAGVALATPETASAQASLYPSSFYLVDEEIHPKTMELLQRMYGNRLGYRSQRGRVTGTPEQYEDSYYFDEDTFTEEQMMMFNDNVFEFFERIGIEMDDNIYDNDTFSDAQIDLRAVVTHECYAPVRGEMKHCVRMFGPFYNVREAILDNSLRDWLILNNTDVRPEVLTLYDRLRADVQRHQVKQDRYTGLPQSIVTTGGNENVNEEMDDKDSATMLFDHSYKDRVRMNAEFVWRVCSDKYGVRGAGYCFARNRRLIIDPDAGLHINASEAADMIQ